MADILEKIGAYKRQEITAAKAAVPQAEIERRAAAADAPRGFLDALRARKAALLEELALAYQELATDWPEPGPFGPAPVSLSNANLALFRQYNQHVPAFRQMLREASYDFPRFYRTVEELSETPEPQRSRHLGILSERFEEHL